MPDPVLTIDIAIVLAITAVAVVFFIFEWVRVDVVAILVMIALPLSGSIDPSEAFAGLSSNAVVAIIAVIIVGAGLDKTGLVNRIVNPLTRLSKSSKSRMIFFISGAVAVISSIMQNIGAAALFLPALQRMSKKTGVPLSSLLMPVGFCAILGGTLTLVGSSPLILLNDLIRPYGIEPFGLFSVTPIGVALVSAGIIYFVLFGKLVLPGPERETDKPAACPLTSRAYDRLRTTYELKAPEELQNYVNPQMLQEHYGVHVIARSLNSVGEIIYAPARSRKIEPGDELAVVGRDKDIQRLADDFGFTISSDLNVFKEDLSDAVSGLVEAVVGPQSMLIGKTLRESHFRRLHQVNIMALYREGETFYSGFNDMKLKPGDSILIQGRWDRLRILQAARLLLFCDPLENRSPEGLDPKAWIAGAWLAVSLIMVLALKLQLAMSLMTGAAGMIVSRVITIDEAYEAVDWRTVFLLGGLIPLGAAMMKTGAASYLAEQIMGYTGSMSPLFFLIVISVLSTVFTLVTSNVGAAVLLVPLVIPLAMDNGVDPRIAVLIVGLATSNSFVLPTHQVNALYMGPGRYSSRDYIKAGSIMSVLFIAVMIGTVYLFYGV